MGDGKDRKFVGWIKTSTESNDRKRKLCFKIEELKIKRTKIIELGYP